MIVYEGLFYLTLTYRNARFNPFTQRAHVVRVRQVVVIEQRMRQRVSAPKFHEAARLWPKYHREHAEHVLVIQIGQVFVVELVAQAVSVLDGRAWKTKWRQLTLCGPVKLKTLQSIQIIFA